MIEREREGERGGDGRDERGRVIEREREGEREGDGGDKRERG